MEHKELQEIVNKVFLEAFVHTSLTKRLEDISGECRELCNYTDLTNLKEEAGDLLASLIQLCNESGWDISELVKSNEAKIRRRMLQYKGRGRKTQVAILGGAFDCCTKAHIGIANLVLKASKWADEVWMMPAFQHMDGKQMLSSEHRIKMLKIAASNDGRIKVCDYEIKHQLHGETYHMLNKLIHDKEYENYRFSFVMGIDRANTIKDWYNFEELLKMDVPFIVVPRNGVKRDECVKWYLQSPHIYIHDEEKFHIPAVSSTMARNILKEKNPSKDKLKEILDEKVIDYILKNNLYK
jgi:nicotinate (nicotinamide) nucleotide adenylyltransferase